MEIHMLDWSRIIDRIIDLFYTVRVWKILFKKKDYTDRMYVLGTRWLLISEHSGVFDCGRDACSSTYDQPGPIPTQEEHRQTDGLKTWRFLHFSEPQKCDSYATVMPCFS